MNSKRLSIIATIAALATTAAAQNTPPPIPLALRARFGFTGPLIHKVGNGLGYLQTADLDGDGNQEVIVLDAPRARIVVLDVVAGAVQERAIGTGGQIAGMRYVDVRGDGRSLPVLVDSRGRLAVRDEHGGMLGDPIDLGLGSRGVQLLAGDIDGDGREDVAAIGRGRLRLATGLLQGTKLSAMEPLEEKAWNTNLIDLTGDGALDLVCITAGDRMNLRLRPGHGDGSFDNWNIMTVDGLGAIFPTRLANGTNALAAIAGSTRRVELLQYGEHDEQAPLQWWAFGDDNGTRTPPFTAGDIDADGDLDLVVFPRGKAEMLVYRWSGETFQRRSVPSLTGVESVAIGDVDGDGKQDLVLASPEEEALAWCSGANQLDHFPQQLPCNDKPAAVATDPRGGVLVITLDRRRNAHLLHTTPGGEARKLRELGRLSGPPSRLLVADVGDRAGIEVSFVVPSEGLRTLTLGGDADSDDGKASAGFTEKLDDGALTISSHDGKPALLAVRDQFVRRFRFDDDGLVRVLEQANGPDGTDKLSLACELPGGGWLFFDDESDKLLRVRGDAPVRSADVPDLAFTHMLPMGDAALLVGARGILRVPFGVGPSLQTVATHERPTLRTYYWFGASGDFDGDGVDDLAVIDRFLPGASILANGPDGLRRALSIPVFETPPSESPDSQPSAVATGDVDGDGRCDMVLIAHDRILIYLQDK